MGVKTGICHAPNPMIWMICPCGAEGYSLGRPFLDETLSGKVAKDRVINAKSLQAIPCKCDGDPSRIEVARPNCLCGTHFREDACQPGTGSFRIVKNLGIRNAQQVLEGRAIRKCWMSSSSSMRASPQVNFAYCIWSSILEKAAFSFKSLFDLGQR